jgi:hypothetical protein
VRVAERVVALAVFLVVVFFEGVAFLAGAFLAGAFFPLDGAGAAVFLAGVVMDPR